MRAISRHLSVSARGREAALSLNSSLEISITEAGEEGRAACGVSVASESMGAGLESLSQPFHISTYVIGAYMDPLDVKSGYLGDMQYKRRLRTAGTEMDTNLRWTLYTLRASRTASWVDNDEERHARSRTQNGHRDGPLSCRKEEEERNFNA
ncbi:hypothetical protein B0H14DRAFT_2659098, partial [Mycena olivaceomarginata]